MDAVGKEKVKRGAATESLRWRMASACVRCVSAEWMLEGRVNGGTIILLRTLWVSSILYAFALTVRSFGHAQWPLEFDPGQLRRDVADTIPWFGAIFAAVYVALYARFSAQWSYLANLYNQMMATQATLDNPNANVKIQLWKAGFIEDAEDLHLATRPMFAVAIWYMLQDPAVAGWFDKSTDGGAERRLKLQAMLRKSIRKLDLPEGVPQPPAATPAMPPADGGGA